MRSNPLPMTERRRVGRTAAVALTLAAVLGAASGCAGDLRAAAPTSAPPTTSAPSPTTEFAGAWRVSGEPAALASGLFAPWSVVPLDGGGALVSERDSGRVRELTPDGTLRDVGVVPDVVSGGESGLHGLALHEGRLYAYYGATGDNRVVRMPLEGAPGGHSLGEAELVFSGIPRANTHNGGRIAFGPDGHLYVTTGDAQIRDAAQDPSALGGKILRLTADGDPAPGNPFDNEVYSYGHRNVQGIAWTADGRMWASEFGQNTWDELNLIESGGNYGWPIVEGDSDDPAFVSPLATWATSELSPSGVAAVGDTVFVAGLRGERLWFYDTSTGAKDTAFAGQGRLRDAVAAPDGTLWVLTNNTDGRGAPREGDDLLLRLALTPA